jgi:hypothetical protein
MQRGVLVLAVVAIAGCTDRDAGVDDASTTGTSSSAGPDEGDDDDSASNSVDDGPVTVDTGNPTSVDGSESVSESGTDGESTGGGCVDSDRGCMSRIDLLFVIDNSGTMGEEQLNLARNFPLLVQQLEELTDAAGTPVNPDVQIMVTTTDMGNPLCTPFEPDGYDPAQGAPTTTGCNARIDDFTGLTIPPIEMAEACTNVCPTDLEPSDPFIAFSADGDNVPDVAPADINGDGMPDSPAAQTLACVGPQGINGCGYEAQLESMLQALNPEADWNQGGRPFLREGAVLGIVVITDEVECSVADFSIMEDSQYQELNPNNGSYGPSSAICWNAGVICSGPNARGLYSDCQSIDDGNLTPVDRYTDYLIDELRVNQGKEVMMLGILGVPVVTAHSPEPPYEPTVGGVADLVYREWEDGPYPAGDILPDEWADGITAADKVFAFGNIGPGCTGEDGMGGFTGQAIPNTRVTEVCQALDLDGEIRCCIESICDDDFSPAIRCLTGLIGTAVDGP